MQMGLGMAKGLEELHARGMAAGLHHLWNVLLVHGDPLLADCGLHWLDGLCSLPAERVRSVNAGAEPYL